MPSIIINKHGLNWWTDKGVICPDCNGTDLTITESTKDDEAVDDGGDPGAEYGATIECNTCGCDFTASYFERG